MQEEPALRSWWMPFTHNRHFKAHPRLIERGDGAYYTLVDGRRVFDGLSDSGVARSVTHLPR